MNPERSGWYDDPDDPTSLRYFDGVVWTGNRAPKDLPERSSGSDPYAAGRVRRDGDPYASGADPRRSGPHGGGASAGPGQLGAPAPWEAPGPHGGGPAGSPYPRPGQPGAPQQWQQGPAPFGQGRATLHGRALSGWWRRVGALVLDNVVLGMTLGTLVSPLVLPTYRRMLDYFRDAVQMAAAGSSVGPEPPQPDARFYAAGVILAVGALAYDAVCTWRWGKTLGKKAVGIRVVSLDRPERLALGPAFLRALVKLVGNIGSNVPVLGAMAQTFSLINYLWPLWDTPFRQALHDKAGTSAVVVD